MKREKRSRHKKKRSRYRKRISSRNLGSRKSSRENGKLLTMFQARKLISLRVNRSQRVKEERTLKRRRYTKRLKRSIC